MSIIRFLEEAQQLADQQAPDRLRDRFVTADGFDIDLNIFHNAGEGRYARAKGFEQRFPMRAWRIAKACVSYARRDDSAALFGDALLLLQPQDWIQ